MTRVHFEEKIERKKDSKNERKRNEVVDIFLENFDRE